MVRSFRSETFASFATAVRVSFFGGFAFSFDCFSVSDTVSDTDVFLSAFAFLAFANCSSRSSFERRSMIDNAIAARESSGRLRRPSWFVSIHKRARSRDGRSIG